MILEEDEMVQHFEYGGVNLIPNRMRLGAIVVTTKRLIVIGDEYPIPHEGERNHIKYPSIEKFTLETYKIPKGTSRVYLVKPEPHDAAIFNSLDYFYLRDLKEYRQSKSTIECTFRNQSLVNIHPYGIKNPRHIIRSYLTWDVSKVPARQKESTGDFSLEIILSGEADYESGIHGPNKRAELLTNAIKELVDPTIDTKSSYL